MQDWLEANRASWDERTLIHVPSRFYDVDGWLHDQRGPRPHEIDVLGDVTGLRLLHLQCHFGLDTLSWGRATASVRSSRRWWATGWRSYGSWSTIGPSGLSFPGSFGTTPDDGPPAPVGLACP